MLAAILDEYGIKTIPVEGRDREPMETKAGGALQKLLDDHGEEHLRAVLTCIAETQNNAMALTRPIIMAVSKVLRAQRDWWDADASAFLAVLDGVDLTRVHDEVRGNLKASPAAPAIATLLYRALATEFAPRTPELFDEDRQEGAAA
ncbi:hypothetical protein ATO13_22086 [Stappia sp. 22II-S9-Z10]|nr:hypothetical protein ATO13_22086 [Stappia sp. 22II-S9-Z10]